MFTDGKLLTNDSKTDIDLWIEPWAKNYIPLYYALAPYHPSCRCCAPTHANLNTPLRNI